jgi:F0F1-type ATP synthase membrane subunit b/b'
MSNATKDDVIMLGGREFRRAKNGLDEAQLVPFVDELIKEREKLAKSQDHIASLNRLAEMTIVEADKLAGQIKTEATEQAKAESAAIIDKAKEQVRQASERKIAEAVRTANEQASAIKAKAEEEAVLLLENQKNKIRGELRNLVNQQFGYMLEELESLKQQAAAVQADFGNKLSESGEKSGAEMAKMKDEKEAPAEEAPEVWDAAAEIEEKREAAAAEIAEESDSIVAEFAGKMSAAVRENSVRDDDSMAAGVSAKGRGETLAPGRIEDDTQESPELAKLLEVEEEPDLGKPQWEVEIVAPFDISRIMEVVSFLDALPEVANTEMIVPQIDMPSILVFLRKPINFVELLKTVPAVASVEEVTPETASANGKARKVRISLSKNTKSQVK